MVATLSYLQTEKSVGPLQHLVSTKEGFVSGLLAVKQEMRTGVLIAFVNITFKAFNHQLESVHHQGGGKKEEEKAKQEMQ